jgi:hypothetical protein
LELTAARNLHGEGRFEASKSHCKTVALLQTADIAALILRACLRRVCLVAQRIQRLLRADATRVFGPHIQRFEPEARGLRAERSHADVLEARRGSNVEREGLHLGHVHRIHVP